MRDEEDTFNQRLNDALKRNEIDLTGDKPIGMDQEQSDFGAASSGLAQGMRLGLEFLSGTVVGMGIGYGIDRYFDTTPWFLLIFTLLGFGAGILNVYRDINNIQEGIGINKQNSLTKAAKKPIQHPTD